MRVSSAAGLLALSLALCLASGDMGGHVILQRRERLLELAFAGSSPPCRRGTSSFSRLCPRRPSLLRKVGCMAQGDGAGGRTGAGTVEEDGAGGGVLKKNKTAVAGLGERMVGTVMSFPGLVGGGAAAISRSGQNLRSIVSNRTVPSPSMNATREFLSLPFEQWKLQQERSRQKVKVNSVEELEEQLARGVSIYDMDIRGVSQPWRQDSKGSLLESFTWETVLEESRRGDGREEQLKHPVLEAIWNRVREGSKPGKRTDRYKIAIAIEGGGLRGSVTAGMASAVMGLELADAFDMVLGSSAGSIIGSYLVARADANTTYNFFCDHLTTSKQKLNGSSWLDMGRLVDLFVPALSNPETGGAPMLLDYPMKTIMQELLPVDWETFAKNDVHQPMKVIATGLFTEGPVALGSQEGSYHDLPSLCECVKASCMLPGVAGVEPPWLKGSSSLNPAKLREGREKWQDREFSRSVWKKARDSFQEKIRKQKPGVGGTALIRNAFDRINTDGSGGIDRLELKAALTDIGLNVTESQLETIFTTADIDGNGLIDYNEFKTLIYSLQSLDAQWADQKWKGNLGGKGGGDVDVEPFVDALIYEPIPYRTAVDYGCTHVLVLRSYPDGKLLPKSLLGLFESIVAPKCLDPFPEVKKHLQESGHSIVYAEDILRLNHAVARPRTEDSQVDDARDVGRSIAAQTAVREGLIEAESVSGSMPREREPQLLAIAPLDADGEVSQLTLKREALITGILQGFARAYDVLVPDDLPERKTGYQAAVETYLPLHYKFMQQQAEEQMAKEAKGTKVERGEPKLKTGTQVLNVKWAKRQQNDIDSRGLPVGASLPSRWSEGVHYKFSEESTFTKNEMVAVRRSSGKLTLARVIGIAERDVILQVEESPETKERERGGEPALYFRVHDLKEVGKLSMGLCAESLLEGADFEGDGEGEKDPKLGAAMAARLSSYFKRVPANKETAGKNK